MQIVNLIFYFILFVLSLPSQLCISLTAHLSSNRLHMKCRTANTARGHLTEWPRPNHVSLLDFAFEFQSGWSKVPSIHYGDERAPKPQSFLASESELPADFYLVLKLAAWQAVNLPFVSPLLASVWVTSAPRLIPSTPFLACLSFF